MIFHSLAFAVFLSVVFLLYWSIPQRHRWILLLAANYYFYMSFKPEYALLLLFATGVSYVCTLSMVKAEKQKTKKLWLFLGICVSVALILCYKYASFLTENVSYLLKALSLPVGETTLKLLLPIGISFYTFKTISYMVDVYRGKLSPETHFGYYAVYVSFFPTVVSGPIDRAIDTLPMLKKETKFSYEEAVWSLRRMLLGFGKKILIADMVGNYVDLVFGQVYDYTGWTLVIAAVLFTFQIYCDFSGYSDIAIGTAGLLGIACKQNFKSPYCASSIREFWGRWHISLSTWFRDYIYIPLGGNRVNPWRNRVNLMATFLVSGLWHGANWTFILWGGIHGFYQIIENATNKIARKSSQKWPEKAVRIVITFVLIAIAWIFFRADSISDAFYILTHMWSGTPLMTAFMELGMTKFDMIQIFALLVALMGYDFVSEKVDILKAMDHWKAPFRWVCYLGIVFLLFVLSVHNGTSQEFIYFKF